jgi:hypothetical protein
MAKASISVDEADRAWLEPRAKRLHGGNLSVAMVEEVQLLRHLEAMSSLLDGMRVPRLTASQLTRFSAELEGTAKPGRRARKASRSTV